jgi:hypothetical protein
MKKYIKEYWEFSKNLYNHNYYNKYSKDTILKYLRNMDLVDAEEELKDIEIQDGKFTAKDSEGNEIKGDVGELTESQEYKNVVYHGSPYDFDYFSLNMFGEGEGASGWGHGIYFTEDFDDAEEYARKLERKENEGVVYKCYIPERDMFFELNETIKMQSDFVKNKLMDIPDKYKILFLEGIFEYKDFKKDVDDNIDEYIFEKDDKNYKAFLKDILDTEFSSIGNHFFDILKEKLGDEYSASMFLKKLGIKGNVHKSFHYDNYIVFDEEDIEIIEKIYRK